METMGVLMDVKRFAVHDGPGIRTTLFLKGCTLKCQWCHNPEGISPTPQLAFYAHKCVQCGECARVCPTHATAFCHGIRTWDASRCAACGACEAACIGQALFRYGRSVTVQEAMDIAMEDETFYGDTGGVTLSGGEPLLQQAFAAQLLHALHQRVHTAVDTCANVPWEAFTETMPDTDLYLVDVKHIDADAHRRLTGKSNERILDNLRRLSKAGANLEIRIPLIPTKNDDDATVEGIGRFLSELRLVRVKVLPYHALARSKYAALNMPDTMPLVDAPTEERLDRVVGQLTALGVPAVSGRA